MKRIACLVVGLLLLAVQYADAEVKIGGTEVKIGVVDLMRALNESDSGKKAKADLEGLIKSKQVQLDTKGKEIEKLKGEVEKQSSVLSAEARKSREDELERMLRDYQRLVSDSQAEVKKKENEVTGGIIREIRAIVDKIGEEGGYTLVIENAEGIILYSKKDLDLTDSVIKRFNESKAKGKDKK
jgi:outer membrane protein